LGLAGSWFAVVSVVPLIDFDIDVGSIETGSGQSQNLLFHVSGDIDESFVSSPVSPHRDDFQTFNLFLQPGGDFLVGQVVWEIGESEGQWANVLFDFLLSWFIVRLFSIVHFLVFGFHFGGGGFSFWLGSFFFFFLGRG
jgi:hypothetical protein